MQEGWLQVAAQLTATLKTLEDTCDMALEEGAKFSVKVDLAEVMAKVCAKCMPLVIPGAYKHRFAYRFPCSVVYSKVLSLHSSFARCKSRYVFEWVCKSASPHPCGQVHPPGKYIVKFGQPGSSMFFITKGMVALLNCVAGNEYALQVSLMCC